MDIQCTECDSDHLEFGRLTNADDMMFVPSHARFLASTSTVRVEVYVCMNCGHVMLQCDPEELRRKVATDATV